MGEEAGRGSGIRGFRVAAPSARDLDASLLVRRVEPAPKRGWRRAVFQATAGKVNVGDSVRERERRNLADQVRVPLHGCYRIALLSLKGGVGKTTTTVTLGSTFAALRGDRVIAVDANPDRGTLSQKVLAETSATVRTLLRDESRIGRYGDVRAYTSQNAHRLEVLASDTDPAVSEAFSGADYERTLGVLERFYSIVLTDCGTGLMHSAMSAILENADALVVISSGSVDGARSASATLDWLDAHGYRRLVEHSIAVVNAVRPRAGKVDLDRLIGHFEQRCRAVHVLPFDPHLEEGAEVDLERLQPRTRRALLGLAADMAGDFAQPAHRGLPVDGATRRPGA
ncbi:MinD/ParA family ATP-binding protein [Rhodococcus chondri]|uniref:MinD/ParA family protein n=1 Tax=Rhodococcus chondri TaxID=3065941 RepID=A0ABU7JZ06_9NOCA|nr:MinD/ParA family protein [Rhodococcus sp. CC-R104]MEE2034799.1 MinD/ParA family protein [Rhodococcus sp. CC-R104]